jgi:hypothetical protein
MLETFRNELFAYFNSTWGRRLVVWLSLAICIASLAFVIMLGFGNNNGGSGTAGGKVAAILSLILAIPAIIVLNLAVAAIYALIRCIVLIAFR